MWVKHFRKVYKNVSPSEIWRLWTDINHWVDWHDDIEYCKLEGDFVVGGHFMLKPKGAAAVRIEITEIEMGRKFTDCTRFWGAKMIDTHELIVGEEGVTLINTLSVTGPLKWLWILLVARNVAATVPAENDALVNLARSFQS